MIEAIEFVLSILFAALAILSAVGFVIFRQPVYAALSFAAAVLAASALYVLQDAAYVAAATMVIYAGATIIIFLFVLMFAQHSNLQLYELKYSNLGPALVASLCLILLLCYAVGTRSHMSNAALMVSPSTPAEKAQTENAAAKAETEPATTDAAATSKATAPEEPAARSTNAVVELGRVAYTRYLWTIELAGTLLLIAAGGAIIIAQRDTESASSTGVSA